MKIRNKLTGEIREVSPTELTTYGLAAKAPSTTTTVNRPSKNVGPSGLESNLPMVGDVAGGFLGPVGAGAGYSIGDSLRTIIEELRKGFGEAAKTGDMKRMEVTPFMQQRLKETGDTLPQRQGMASIALENMTDPENLKRAADFAVKNIAGSVGAGTTDYLFGKAFDKVLSAAGGPLMKVKGLLPKTIVKNAEQLSGDVWKPIQEGIDKLTKSNKKVDVTSIVEDLTNKISDVKAKFPDGMPSGATDEIAGITKVLDDLRASSNEYINSLTGGPSQFLMSPTTAQSLKSYFGKTSFSPITKLGKEASDIEKSAELLGKKTVAPQLKKLVTEQLKEAGVENADELFKRYGQYKNLADIVARNPFAGASQAGITGGALSGVLALLGAGPGAASIPLMTSLAFMPYARQLFRQGVMQPGADTLQTVLRAVMGNYLDKGFND